MADKIFAQGTQIQSGNEDGPPETFTAIPSVGTITGPSDEFEEIDVTTHDSPGGSRELVAGLRDFGELSFEIMWDPEDPLHARLASDAEARKVRTYHLVLPNTAQSTFTFEAFVKGRPGELPVDGVAKQNITLRITGAFTKV